jgi:hypothetical protein
LPTSRLKSSVEADVRIVWKLVDLRLADSSEEAVGLRGYTAVAAVAAVAAAGALRGGSASALPPLRLRRWEGCICGGGNGAPRLSGETSAYGGEPDDDDDEDGEDDDDDGVPPPASAGAAAAAVGEDVTSLVSTPPMAVPVVPGPVPGPGPGPGPPRLLISAMAWAMWLSTRQVASCIAKHVSSWAAQSDARSTREHVVAKRRKGEGREEQ